MKFSAETCSVKDASGKVVGARVASMSFVFENGEVVTVGSFGGMTKNLSEAWAYLLRAFKDDSVLLRMKRMSSAVASQQVLFTYSGETKPIVDGIIEREVLGKLKDLNKIQ